MNPEHRGILFLKGSHKPVYFLNMFKFPAFSSRSVQTNKHLHLRLFPTTKGPSFWMWSLCFLFDPLFAAEMKCHCCSSLPVVTITTNPVISSIHFRATSANHCFMVAFFPIPHINQGYKTLKLCSSTQLLTFLIGSNHQNFLCFFCSPFGNTFLLIAHMNYSDSP